MKTRAEKIRRFLRTVNCRFGAGFAVWSFLLLAPSYVAADARNVPVKVSLKVCVVDAEGRPVDVKPTLFNSPARISQRQGDCYSSGEIILDPRQMYFVGAVKEDLSGFAFVPVTVTPADQGKVITTNLKLKPRLDPDNTAIEICLNSASDPHLVLTDIQLSNNKTLVSEDKGGGCRRLTVPAASQIKLDVSANPKVISRSDSTFSSLGLWGMLLLTIASLTLTVLLFLRVKDLGSRAATNESTAAIFKSVGELAAITGEIGPSIKSLHDIVIDRDTVKTREENQQTASPIPPKHETQPAIPPSPTRGQISQQEATSIGPRYRSEATARQQYWDFSHGGVVEHFYLMPSGSSSATDMVEEAPLELLERNNGTYVAFRSASDDTEAWVFPMPGIHFTGETFRAVFPDLTMQDYERGEVEPRLLVLQGPSLWKLSE